MQKLNIKQIKEQHIDNSLSFKELSSIYDHIKNEQGEILLREINEEQNKLEKHQAFSYAQFVRIIKSSDSKFALYFNN